jgi:hypothetical protein
MFVANMNSFALDYAARQKVGGTHMSNFILKQLPVLARPKYRQSCAWGAQGGTFASWIMPRVLELSYPAWDLESFAKDCGYNGPPFRWDSERRFLIRCELDAAFFHLYGIAREDVDYIMDTFPIVRRKDEELYGAYRTKDTILEIYDALADAVRTGQPYQTRLNPPPADPSMAHGAKPVVHLAVPAVALDPTFPSSPRDRMLCGAVLDLVLAEPGLPEMAYVDAVGLLTVPKTCEKLLHDMDQRSWRSLVRKAPDDLTRPGGTIPWYLIRQTLLANGSLQVAGNAGLGVGPRQQDVRSGYPNLDSKLVALAAKAAQSLRELQDTAGSQQQQEARRELDNMVQTEAPVR